MYNLNECIRCRIYLCLCLSILFMFYTKCRELIVGLYVFIDFVHVLYKLDEFDTYVKTYMWIMNYP